MFPPTPRTLRLVLVYAAGLAGQGTRGRGFNVDAVRRVRLMTATILTATTRCLPNHRPTERAALVGLVTSTLRRVDADQSLDELAGLADAAGASVVLRMLQERPKPDPATFIGGGQGREPRRRLRRGGRRRRDLRQRADARAAPPARGEARAQGRRSHAADSRHLRAPRADARGQVAGRARAVEVPAAAPRGQRNRVVASRRRHRHARPWRNEARNRSPAHSRPHPVDSARDRPGAAAPLAAARAPAEAVGPDRRARRLHQRRQDDAVQPADERAGGRVRRAVRDARSAVRQVRLPDQRELLVSDTVGFIDRLPHALVAAFRATLEEVAEADLALHVIDAASPDRERHMAAVRRVLEEVGAAERAGASTSTTRSTRSGRTSGGVCARRTRRPR